MKKMLFVIILFVSIAATAQQVETKPEREFKFKFSEKKVIQIINALSTTESLSAKDANILVVEIQKQANDSTMNPIPKQVADKPKDLPVKGKQ